MGEEKYVQKNFFHNSKKELEAIILEGEQKRWTWK